MMQHKRVLVTGGAGFIGHRVTKLLAARGQQVAVVDNSFVPMPMPKKSEFVTPYAHDIRDVAAMAQVFVAFKPDAVIHLAALHHIPTCEAKPHLAMDMNVMGTQVVLDAAAKHGVHDVVMASSAAVYDWWESALIEDETPITATDVYSTTKIANEHQGKIWAARTDGRVALARIFNAIGHDDPNGHIIPDILKQVLQGESVVKLGNTAPKRDYTHADDTAAGVVALLDHVHLGAPVEAYNLSFGADYSVVELVEVIGDYLGRQLTIVSDPARVRKIDRVHLLGDTRKTRRVTGWQAQMPFVQAVQQILMKLVPEVARTSECVA